MKVSLNWLKRYVNITVSVQELCDKMTMSGFEVDGIEDLSETMDNVKVGRILKIEKHPDADKLQVCQVDIGEEAPIQIITGAQPISYYDTMVENIKAVGYDTLLQEATNIHNEFYK